MVAGNRNTGFLIECLHIGLGLVAHDRVALVAGCDVEVCAQACILLEPELVVAFKPVNLAVLMRKPCDGAVHLIVIHHGADLIVLVHRFLQFLRE